MTVRLLIDMNLTPDWVDYLVQAGWPAIHWSQVGDYHATDRTIMAWAVANGYSILTQDLDFGTLLALTRATGPSVVQIRAQDVLPAAAGPAVVAALARYSAELAAGALITVD